MHWYSVWGEAMGRSSDAAGHGAAPEYSGGMPHPSAGSSLAFVVIVIVLASVQMTYAGDNPDILTGVLAIGAGLSLWRRRAGRRTVLAFSIVGLVLLVNVMSVALRSVPGPMRTYMNEPPLLLPVAAPYTWIVSVCVAGALFGRCAGG